jgi:GH24 family phage-related lysozyme (muramidase)
VSGRQLLKEGDMNAAADKVARAQYDLNAENTARFGGRQLLKEGDMNAAADKIARTQYDLNAENAARFAAVSGRSLLQQLPTIYQDTPQVSHNLAMSRFSGYNRLNGGRHLLKEGDMNAAAEKVARAQYDLNSDNVARWGYTICGGFAYLSRCLEVSSTAVVLKSTEFRYGNSSNCEFTT